MSRTVVPRAAALLVEGARLKEGLPGEIGVVRSVTALEDALQLICEETAGAEEA